MTHLSQPTESRPGSRAEQIEWFVAGARAILALERGLPALWPVLAVAGLFAAASLFDLFAFLPWPLHALLLGAAITGIGLALERGLPGFAWPGWNDGAKRLEHDSGFRHRPISEKDDRLAAGRGDVWSEALWRIHRIRVLPPGRLSLSWPRPNWRTRDPHGLRYYLLLLLATGLVVARGDSIARLAGAFESDAHASVDAWVNPPAYTGLPPVYLAQGGGNLAVPENSTLNLRVHGAGRTPGLALGMGAAGARFAGTAGEYTSSARIRTASKVRVRAGGRTIGSWNLRIIADKPPSIAFASIPARTERDAVKFTYTTQDDYGVVAAQAILKPHRGGGKPLIVDLAIAQGSAKKSTQTTFADLTGHPYAGLEVDATLEARDAAGNVGRSRTVRFMLPGRVFTDPLARALVEQRSNLAVGGLKGRGPVALTLDALTIAPDRFYAGKLGLYLGLRSAYWGVKNAHNDQDLERVENLLWQIATSLEQGGLLDAAAELRRLQQLLTQALASGAPQNAIDALLDRYNEAMQKYMQALAQNPSAASGAASKDAKTIGPQDIEALLKAIRQLAQSGNRAQAAQMLAVLQNMLENMRMAKGTGPGQSGSPANKAMEGAIGKLGEMMGKQRALLDKTFRQQQGTADPKDGGAQGLAKQQSELQSELQQLQKSLGPAHGAQLGPAGKAMGDASRDLGARDLSNADSDQKDALDALKRGAEALAQQLLPQKNGQGRKGGEEDPLGRGVGIGNNVKIPDASDLARARTILQELRKRAGERGRPQEELDYIDRLLKLF